MSPEVRMILERNMFMAKEAVAYARSKLSIGASNKWKDIKKSGLESLICVPAMRSIDYIGQQTTELRFIRAVAAVAEHVGCGNCGENASIAFMYLLDRGVKPLDFMEGGSVDHAFVVVGRPASSTAADSKTWGKEAVVCDPWHEEGGAYLASEFLNRMYKGEQMVPTVFYRVE